MTLLTGDQFYSLLTTRNAVRDIEVTEDIRQKNTESQTVQTGLDLTNSKFANVEFPAINYNFLRITGCRFKELNFNKHNIKVIEIANCTIEKLTFLAVNFQVHLSINNCQIGEIQLVSSTVTKLIINIDYTSSITIKDNSTDKVSIESSEAKNEVDVLNFSGNMSSLMLTNLKVKKTQFIDSILGRVSFSNCDITEELSFKNSESSNLGILTINDSYIKNLDTQINSDQINFFSSHFDKIKFHNKVTKHLIFDLSNKEPKIDCTVNELDLCGIECRLLKIKSTKLQELKLNNFECPSGMDFQFLRLENKFLFESSNAVESSFHNVYFSRQCEIRFLNSSLADSEIINVRWPHEYKFYEYKGDIKNVELEKKLDILWPLKESYRQLKVLSLDQHNKIDALNFQKHELKIYWRTVRLKAWNDLKHFKLLSLVQNLGTWAILGTSYVFSNFGQSIARPLIWLLILHSVWFLILLSKYNLGLEFTTNPSEWESNAFWAGVDMFVNLLSPVHSDEIKNSLMTETISIYGKYDFLMRLTAGYFIYYFIKASRKFNLSL